MCGLFIALLFSAPLCGSEIDYMLVLSGFRGGGGLER